VTGTIQQGVPADVYHQRLRGVVSKSALDQIERSPMHYLAWLDAEEKEPTPALAFGSAFHCALLEPKVFEATYAVQPDFGDCRFKEAKANKAAWLEMNYGKLALSADDGARITGMIASIMKHPAASRLIAEGQAEVTLRWTDESTGLACKSRADYWVKSKRFVVDAKSTEDASPEAFAKSVYKWGYQKQDALYRAGFAACGERIDHFALLAVEKEAPYACAIYVLDADAVAKGHSSVRRDIAMLSECLSTDSWPGYSAGVETLSLPPWAA
jgi:PDDEXK-like uncharacterized protein DUF3799